MEAADSACASGDYARTVADVAEASCKPHAGVSPQLVGMTLLRPVEAGMVRRLGAELVDAPSASQCLPPLFTSDII